MKRTKKSRPVKTPSKVPIALVNAPKLPPMPTTQAKALGQTITVDAAFNKSQQAIVKTTTLSEIYASKGEDYEKHIERLQVQAELLDSARSFIPLLRELERRLENRFIRMELVAPAMFTAALSRLQSAIRAAESQLLQ